MGFQIKKSCEYCGKDFLTDNPSKKYCSNTCRTYASLERKGQLSEVQSELKNKYQESSIGGFVDLTEKRETYQFDQSKKRGPNLLLSFAAGLVHNAMKTVCTISIEERNQHQKDEIERKRKANQEAKRSGKTPIYQNIPAFKPETEERIDRDNLKQALEADYMYGLEPIETSKGNIMICSLNIKAIQILHSAFNVTYFSIPAKLNSQRASEVGWDDMPTIQTAYAMVLDRQALLKIAPYIEDF